MNSVVTIKKNVTKIEDKLQIKSKPKIAWFTYIGNIDKIHSRYGVWKMILGEDYVEVSDEEALRMLQGSWEQNGHRRHGAKDEPKISFEEFLKQWPMCRCPMHKAMREKHEHQT